MIKQDKSDKSNLTNFTLNYNENRQKRKQKAFHLTKMHISGEWFKEKDNTMIQQSTSYEMAGERQSSKHISMRRFSTLKLSKVFPDSMHSLKQLMMMTTTMSETLKVANPINLYINNL